MVNQVVIVTGGSRGIGAATARMAAAQGYAVILSYRTQASAAAAIVEQITTAGGRALAVQADVSVDAEVVRLFETAAFTFGAVTALVNNAGIVETKSRVAEMSGERLLRVMATNVIGSFLCAREAIRTMSTARGGAGGAIVNVSSAAARLGSPGEFVDYAASKGAIDTLLDVSGRANLFSPPSHSSGWSLAASSESFADSRRQGGCCGAVCVAWRRRCRG